MTYEVQARWDGTTGIGVAESENVPGLVAEAPTPNELIPKLRVLIPELLALNEAFPEDSTGSTFRVTYQPA
jgi:hypothetical protein